MRAGGCCHLTRTCCLQLVDECCGCREPHKVKRARQDAVEGSTGNDHGLQEAHGGGGGRHNRRGCACPESAGQPRQQLQAGQQGGQQLCQHQTNAMQGWIGMMQGVAAAATSREPALPARAHAYGPKPDSTLPELMHAHHDPRTVEQQGEVCAPLACSRCFPVQHGARGRQQLLAATRSRSTWRRLILQHTTTVIRRYIVTCQLVIRHKHSAR